VKKIRSDNGSEFKNLQVEEYHDAHRHGEDNAWRVQDARAVLVGSREHGLPRHKPGLSSSPPQEDFV
jgi:hypothetical protein